jgi:hypothetical protein
MAIKYLMAIGQKVGLGLEREHPYQPLQMYKDKDYLLLY